MSSLRLLILWHPHCRTPFPSVHCPSAFFAHARLGHFGNRNGMGNGAGKVCKQMRCHRECTLLVLRTIPTVWSIFWVPRRTCSFSRSIPWLLHQRVYIACSACEALECGQNDGGSNKNVSRVSTHCHRTHSDTPKWG